jgi:hypothetical protein
MIPLRVARCPGSLVRLGKQLQTCICIYLAWQSTTRSLVLTLLVQVIHTNTKTLDKPPPLTRCNLTAMAPIDDAVAAINLLEPGEHFSYRTIACQYGVLKTTLTQRHQGCQHLQEAENTSQLALNPQQEATLVHYIEDLTKKALSPTREMIQNSAAHFNSDSVSES